MAVRPDGEGAIDHVDPRTQLGHAAMKVLGSAPAGFAHRVRKLLLKHADSFKLTHDPVIVGHQIPAHLDLQVSRLFIGASSALRLLEQFGGQSFKSL
jgi:hypothetical protein